MNLIVICLDTFRADLVGPGHNLSFVETPNLDAFARESVVFDRAFGEGQPTLQMRRAFFTGRRSFPWRYNFDRRGHWHHAPGWHKIPPDQDTMAEILLSRGYFTGLVADTYHMFKPTMNYTRGFVTYEFIRGQETDNWRGGTPAMIEDQVRHHAREPLDWAQLTGLVQYLYNMRGRQREEDYLCARVFRSAAQWLEDNSANAPFFLWVDSFDPHVPMLTAISPTTVSTSSIPTTWMPRRRNRSESRHSISAKSHWWTNGWATSWTRWTSWGSGMTQSS
jgi:arylsulfatase A-like enzyme